MSHFNINHAYVLAEPSSVWHVSSLIRGEGAISLNTGVINPRSHPIRRHAQFVQRAVYWVNKQGRGGLTVIIPVEVQTCISKKALIWTTQHT